MRPSNPSTQILGSKNIADSRAPSFNAQIGQTLKPGIKAAFLKRFLLDLGDPPPNIRVDNKIYKAFYDRMDLSAFAAGEMISCIGSFQIHQDGAMVVVIRCWTPDKPANAMKGL